jgi:hypothetical protein
MHKPVLSGRVGRNYGVRVLTTPFEIWHPMIGIRKNPPIVMIEKGTVNTTHGVMVLRSCLKVNVDYWDANKGDHTLQSPGYLWYSGDLRDR